MDRLIYTAMTGAKQILEQQATVAHNLANAATTGFRAQIDSFRAVPIIGDGLPTRAFVVDATIGTDFSAGPIQRTGRKDAISTPANARDKTNPRVILGYDSYFGHYTVDEKAGTVTHHVEGSLYPEDLGSDWVRPFTLDGDKLTLRLSSGGLTRTLIFQRLR